MPYPSGHRDKVRARIVDSARRLFNRHGFNNVSIAQIMAGAKLTHGGFYSYFNSKSDLYASALNCFFTDPNWRHCWEGVTVRIDAPDAGAQVVNAYLSKQHFEDVENSCPMVALPTDVSRAGAAAKQAFQTVFQAMSRVLARTMPANGKSRTVTSQAIAAMCVGGMVVARAMVDRKVADKLRDACAQTALHLGGWNSRELRSRKPPSRK